MKKLIVFLILITLAACGSDQPENAAIPQGATVLVLGDSLSYGTGANAGEDYPSLIAKAMNWNIVNAGVPGDTTAGGLARLPDLLNQHQPKLLIVELGGNDFLRRLPQDQTIANLKSILSLSKAQGISTVLVAIPEFNVLLAAVGNLSDHTMYETIAEETATPLITEVFSDVLSDKSLKADEVHPNAQGYMEVGNKMREKLKQLGFAS